LQRILIHQRSFSNPKQKTKKKKKITLEKRESAKIKKTENEVCGLGTYPLSPRTMTLSKVLLRKAMFGCDNRLIRDFEI